MSKEFNFLLEQKSLLEPDQNFLIFHQSYPFTSAQLRQKRLLAFFLKKWLLLNGNPTLAMIIITFLLSIIPRNYTTSEDELLDIFESIVQNTHNAKYYTKRMVDSMVAEYSQEHRRFKTNKKQMKFILVWYSALIRTDDYEELFFSLKNRIDQRIFEGIDSTLIFLLAQLSRDHNFDEVDHAMVVDHMKEFSPNEVYVINEYAKDMQYYYKDEEVLDYLAILRFSESKDALALQKTYVKSLQKIKSPEIITEAKDVLRKDPYDARNIDLIFDCLEKVQENEDDQDELFLLLDILLEMIPVNNNKKRIWRKFRVFLETFSDQLLLSEYFDAQKSNDFIELHYNKLPLLNDAKEYISIKKKSMSKSAYKMELLDYSNIDSDNCLMEDKVIIVKIVNESDPTAQGYIAAFEKISNLS